MLIVHRLDDIPTLPLPCGLTIGAFDGAHLGHQRLLKELRAVTPAQGTTAALTFSNHPAQVLLHRPPSPLICSMEHKLLLLEETGIDLVILLEFTPELAHKTYTEFFEELRRYLPFSFLVLGKGAAFGKGRQGDEARVQELGKKMNFRADYLSKLIIDGEPVSSGRVRRCIAEGKLDDASRLLGRRYSIYGKFEAFPENPRKGELIAEGLCLPPAGSYPISVHGCKGIAEVDSKIILTLDSAENLSSHHLDVIFN